MASSLESNKIAAAVLTAGVIAMFSGFIAELVYEPEVHLEENAYQVATGESGSGGEAQKAAAEPQALEPIAPLLASADVANGEKISKKCGTCHTLDKGGPNKIGPNLYGVVGRPIASHPGFSYDDALLAHKDDTWTYANLNHFLHSPKDFAPGTKMSFAGLPKVQDRADLVAYLRTLSDSPVPLPQ